MPQDLLGYICAATVAAGGIIGYTKAASIPSLTAGLAFGSLLGIGAYYTSQDPPRPVLQLGTACVLAAMMGARWTKSGNFMPGGIVCLLSCAVVVRDLYFYNKYLPLPGSHKVLFDTETFIQEVEKFQCIWDNSSPLYTSATEKAKAWETIARNIFPTHLEKTIEEQKAMLIILKRRWKSIRDSYRKELKYQSEKKFGLETKFRKVYIFYDLLKFLKPIMSENAVAEDDREDDDGIDNTLDDIEGNELSSAETFSEKKARILKRKMPSTKSFAKETFYTILAESIKQKEQLEANQNDEDALFMLSLVKDVKRVPDNLKLQFKAEFMSKFSELVQKYTYFPTTVPCSYTTTPLTPLSTTSSTPGNGAEYKIDVQGINVQYLQPHAFSSDGQ